VPSIQPIIPKISKWTNGAEIARKFEIVEFPKNPKHSTENYGNAGRETEIRNFQKFLYISQGCPLFWKFWKILSHLPLGISRNANQDF